MYTNEMVKILTGVEELNVKANSLFEKASNINSKDDIYEIEDMIDNIIENVNSLARDTMKLYSVMNGNFNDIFEGLKNMYDNCNKLKAMVLSLAESNVQ